MPKGAKWAFELPIRLAQSEDLEIEFCHGLVPRRIARAAPHHEELASGFADEVHQACQGVGEAWHGEAEFQSGSRHAGQGIAEASEQGYGRLGVA